LIEELGLNIAGVEIILRLTDRIRTLELQLEQMRQQLDEYERPRARR
jgi:hypothetical protein